VSADSVSAHLTPVQDLGPLAGPVVLFGGPYGNIQATEALIAQAERLGVSAARRICTGDVVAYCADAQDCVARVRVETAACVMGNCEESVGFGSDDCGCGYGDGTACDVLSKSWYGHAKAAVDAEAKAWMRALPRIVTFTVDGLRVAAVHGGATVINRFVFASAPDHVLEDEIAALAPLRPDIVVGGHAGIPFARTVGGVTWLNAGVIGMPANDGTPRTWFATLRARNGHPEARFHALSYDHGAAARALRAAGLPDAYADTLETGLWPSLDVLPPAERAACGRPLALDGRIVSSAA
jgi:predicted phosphodiesterase